MRNVVVTGVKELNLQLESLPARVRQEVMKEIKTVALTDIETPAKMDLTNKGHVVTGRLRSSIHTTWKGRQPHRYTDDEGTGFNGDLPTKLGEDEVAVGSNVVYARRMERLDPYLFPAFEAAKPKIQRGAEEAVERAVGR